eukprot:13714053-Alexandrium_andersonii.AAC.1
MPPVQRHATSVQPPARINSESSMQPSVQPPEERAYNMQPRKAQPETKHKQLATSVCSRLQDV